jgi:hypothetical protein
MGGIDFFFFHILSPHCLGEAVLRWDHRVAQIGDMVVGRDLDHLGPSIKCIGAYFMHTEAVRENRLEASTEHRWTEPIGPLHSLRTKATLWSSKS